MTRSLSHISTRYARLSHALMCSILAVGLMVTGLMATADPAYAKAKRNSLLWLTPDSVNLTRELGPPPAPNTPESKSELEAVIALTKARTPQREAVATEDARQSLVRFLEGMDIDISKKNSSEARSLFREADLEMELILHRFKLQYDRKRPFVTNKKAVTACKAKTPNTSSYPSTHAATGTLFAALLAEAAPEIREKVDARAISYGESRVVCGYHYASDVAAGAKAGRLIAAALLANGPFRTRFNETRAEIRATLGL